MRFLDIPQFTRSASYRINVSWGYLEQQLESFAQGYELELEPEFQRAHVWNDGQRSRYVEYVLQGGKSSREIQWNCAEFGKGRDAFARKILLVDGLQRLTAVRKFLANEVRAFGLLRREFEGKLPTLGYMDFVFAVNDLSTYPEVLQWYIDLNTGGVVHTDEEINRVKALLVAQTGTLATGAATQLGRAEGEKSDTQGGRDSGK